MNEKCEHESVYNGLVRRQVNTCILMQLAHCKMFWGASNTLLSGYF